MPSLLGIDSGLTVTKAVLFDEDGSVLSVARRRVPQSIPEPRRVERDVEGLWRATAAAIGEAIRASGRAPDDIRAVAPTAHGDGLYVLDASRRPLGAAILSLDSRAGAIVARWSAGGVADEVLALTGQMPHVSAPSALLAWMRANEPERFARIAHVLGCKDWLRFRLSGEIGTDRTEASTSFTDVRTQDYSHDALRLFGLDSLAGALPPVSHPAATVGRVTDEAAAATGLAPGTPVACGLHDVTASALGTRAHRAGVLGVVAGTYSINEIVADEPRTDARWFCRNAIDPGTWNHMAISPASSANHDWFVDTLCVTDRDAASAAGETIHARLAPEIDAALARATTLLFHPYLYGSPHGDVASASFVGLRGWHDRGDLLKAVLEGVAFNHRTHIDALREGFAIREVRLSGGAARSPAFAQLFADVLGAAVTVDPVDEAAAWGAALCAGASAGLYASVHDDPRGANGRGVTYEPDAVRSDACASRFAVWRSVENALAARWPDIERLTDVAP